MLGIDAHLVSNDQGKPFGHRNRNNDAIRLLFRVARTGFHRSKNGTSPCYLDEAFEAIFCFFVCFSKCLSDITALATNPRSHQFNALVDLG